MSHPIRILPRSPRRAAPIAERAPSSRRRPPPTGSAASEPDSASRHARINRGRDRSGASLLPLKNTGEPLASTSSARATLYPSGAPEGARRSSTSTPADCNAATNSSTSPDATAAARTARASSTRDGPRPCRCAFSISPRPGALAAVPSADAVTVKPRRCSIRRAASRSRGKSRLGQNRRLVSCRTSTTAMWMWSSAWRIATQRGPPASPRAATPAPSNRSRATSAHSASVSTRSAAATRAEQCQTYPRLPSPSASGSSAATAGARTARINGPSSNPPSAFGDGCQPASRPSQLAITLGRTCSCARPGPIR